MTARSTSPALTALLALVMGGCSSFVSIDSARTAGQGGRQLTFAPSLTVSHQPVSVPVNFDLLWRIGLADGLDLGLRARNAGVGVDMKVQIARAANPRAGVDVAVAPRLGAGYDGYWGTTSDALPADVEVALPVLVGVNLGRFQLELAPQIVYERVSTLPDGVISLGGTIAFGRIEGGGYTVYPAVAVWRTIDPHDVGFTLRRGLLSVQPALVMRWGS